MAGKEAPPIASNLPPIAGARAGSAVSGARAAAHGELRLLDRKIMEREEAREAIAEYTTFLGYLDDFRNSSSSPGAPVSSSSQARNLLLRKERETLESTSTELLYVNFDPGLTSLLREVKYFAAGTGGAGHGTRDLRQGEIFRRQWAISS